MGVLHVVRLAWVLLLLLLPLLMFGLRSRTWQPSIPRLRRRRGRLGEGGGSLGQPKQRGLLGKWVRECVIQEIGSFWPVNFSKGAGWAGEDTSCQGGAAVLKRGHVIWFVFYWDSQRWLSLTVLPWATLKSNYKGAHVCVFVCVKESDKCAPRGRHEREEEEEEGEGERRLWLWCPSSATIKVLICQPLVSSTLTSSFFFFFLLSHSIILSLCQGRGSSASHSIIQYPVHPSFRGSFTSDCIHEHDVRSDHTRSHQDSFIADLSPDDDDLVVRSTWRKGL